MEFRAVSSLASRRRAFTQSAAELLRDHPIFELPVPGEDLPALAPKDRKGAWARETLHLFQRRIKVVMLTMIFAILPLWLFATFVTPSARPEITFTQGAMIGACALLYQLASRCKSLRLIRVLALIPYLLFAVMASAVMIESQSPRLIAFSGHPQLVVAMLFVPFSVAEAGLCASIITLATALGMFYTLPDSRHDEILPRAMSITMSGILVVFMVYMQGLARRRAFNAAFDMAVSASQGVALSHSDFLTGGANRRHFEAVVGIELERSTRHKHPLSLLLFDLDGFKAVNDTQGHASGDDVLCEVFRIAQDTVRVSDVVARWGGDEFALALVETDANHARRTAERLRENVVERLNSLWDEGSPQAKVTISVGIASISAGEDTTLAELMNRADTALYNSKRIGKNSVTIG